MKRTREDEPSKTRRGWKRGRPAQNGDGSPPAAKPKRSSRSVFGPSGEDRPDVLTDAETVVLPIWLHRRQSADGKTTTSTAAFLKTIAVPAHEEVPAQEDEAPRPAPGNGNGPGNGTALKTGAEPETEAAPGTDAAPETSEPPEPAETAAPPGAGTEPASDHEDAGAEAGNGRLGDPADADQSDADQSNAEPRDAEPRDAEPQIGRAHV